MSDYIILSPIEPPEKCYLFEVLLWRAFGRYPEAIQGSGDDDWRFEQEVHESWDGAIWDAPRWDGEELTEYECQFAGIPIDPRMEEFLTGNFIFDVEFYEQSMEMYENSENINASELEKFKEEYQEAIKRAEKLAKWMPSYLEYVDQFQNEIILDLRRGHITAYGRKLPDPDRKKSQDILEKNETEFFDLDVTPIPPEAWITSDVDWDGSSILGRTRCFIWIHIKIEDIVGRYPPTDTLVGQKVKILGNGFAISSSSISNRPALRSKRGRPALPWEPFHVEVARMFRDGEMPDKKEAAIFALQEWFTKTNGKSVSRAAIGQKLKPYYDELLKKDRKS